MRMAKQCFNASPTLLRNQEIQLEIISVGSR